MFFIVGRGRSGALLLSRMLMSHPQVVVVPDGGFLLNLYGKYGSARWNAARIDAFCRDLMAEDRMRAWGLDIDGLKWRLYERDQVLTYAEVCREVYQAYAHDALGVSPKWIGDRTPHHALWIGEIDRIFPEARYLHITRDYRDNIRSYRDAALDLNNPAALAQRWMRYNQKILRLSRQAPSRFLWLRYEDLCVQPQQTLARVHDFLELDGTQSTLVHGAFGAAKLRCWEHELSPEVIEQADAVCGPFAERFGYLPSSRCDRPLPLAARFGKVLGECSLVGERLAFRAMPARSRIALSNACDRITHRDSNVYVETHSR